VRGDTCTEVRRDVLSGVPWLATLAAGAVTDKPSSASCGSSFGEVRCGPLAEVAGSGAGRRVEVAERVRAGWARIDLGVRRMGRRRARASAGVRLTRGREKGSDARRRNEKRASKERTSVKTNDQTLPKNDILLNKPEIGAISMGCG
jgi:hypothetical protein